MNCPECNSELEEKDVLVNRTTSPEEDDRFEKMLVCPKCDFCEPIISSDEGEEE